VVAWLDQAASVLDSCMDAFAEEIEYTPSGGSPVTTIGIFDNQYQAVDPETGAIITSTEPMLGVKDANLPRAPIAKDEVSVRGQDYRVIEVQKDGHGGSKLLLHKI
jgi:hypothetical protein